MTMRVGYIGLGIMGRSMAHNILKAGFPLVVYNRTPERARSLVEEGAVQAASPRELAARVDVICSCVTGPHDVEEVALGPNGLIHGLKPGSDVPLPVGEVAEKWNSRLLDMGQAEADQSAYLLLMEQMAGVRVGPTQK